MNRVAAAALVFALLAPSGAYADETPLAVAYDQTISVNVPGATSAYSVNPSIAEANLLEGVVRIRGAGGGTTTVVVVTSSGMTTLSVIVNAPQLAVALGVGADGNGAAPGEITEGGSYEGSYNSGAGQLTNAFDFRQQQGQTSRRVAIVTATYVSPGSGGNHGTGFPLISYEVKSPGHDVTYLDQAVTTSPLTFQDALVRGIHVTNGPLMLHAGVSSVAAFGPYFIPTSPQWIVGATRDFAVSRASDVAANFYDVIDSAGAEPSANGGLIGSLLYTYHPQPHFIASTELGISHSIGFSAAASYDDSTQHADASILDKPESFATLVNEAQQGLFGNFDYQRTFNSRLSLSASGQQSDYRVPAFRENTQTGQGTLTYRLNKAWSFGAGTLYSNFDSIYPIVFHLRTLGVPLTIDYGGRHVSGGVQFTPTTDFSGTRTQAYGANLGFNYGHFQAGGFYNHNVDIPTLSSIFSQVPGLQAALEQAGININDPSQLAALLNNAALLASLGFSGLKLNVAPARNDTGLSAAWTLPGVAGQQVNLNYLDSAAQLTQGRFDFKLATLSYERRLDYGNDVAFAVSSLRSTDTSQINASVAAATSRSSQVTYGVSVRHRFGSVPDFLFPARRGTIEGTVFRDDDSRGTFTGGALGLSDVEVTLDGDQSVRTDARGHYVFTGVPFGNHQVAAQMPGSKPYYFTTDSPATASIGNTVNFGVSFVSGKIFGYVTNDAGEGIAGVTVQVQGLDKTAITEGDGRFVIQGVPAGRYVLSASAESIPTGYDLSSSSPVPVQVSASAPWPANLAVRALRSISGTVTVYDPQRSGLSPAEGMDVAIRQLGLVVKTDANGAYTLRDLPAGTYTVQIDGGTSAERRQVTLPADPATITGVDFRVTIGQAAAERRREHHQRGEPHRRNQKG